MVPYSKCDQIGNPREDNGSVSQRQSVAFANMIATARENGNGKLDIQISAGTAVATGTRTSSTIASSNRRRLIVWTWR